MNIRISGFVSPGCCFHQEHPRTNKPNGSEKKKKKGWTNKPFKSGSDIWSHLHFDKHQCLEVRLKGIMCVSYMWWMCRGSEVGSMVRHALRRGGILLCLFLASGFWLKNGLCLICQEGVGAGGSGASSSPSSPPLPYSPSIPAPSTLRGRDCHHMCKGKVMGGMAALISERLPADKANGCGEAWASALLCNKHFHFVCLDWRMERWKWWIDDLRIQIGRGDVIQY